MPKSILLFFLAVKMEAISAKKILFTLPNLFIIVRTWIPVNVRIRVTTLVIIAILVLVLLFFLLLLEILR